MSQIILIHANRVDLSGKPRLRRKKIQRLILFALISQTTLTSAEPMLHRDVNTVTERVTPKPFYVEDYKGKLTQRYGEIEFTAPGGMVRWDPWTSHRYIGVVISAMRIVEERALGNSYCNAFFRESMPKRRSLSEIWHATDAQQIRISFSPGPSALWRAATYGETSPYEWTITETTVLMGPESVASAMVHEATRTNGIGPETAVAYNAETACAMMSYVLNEPLVRKFKWDRKRQQPDNKKKLGSVAKTIPSSR